MQRTHPQNTEKNLRRGGRTFTSQRHKDKGASSPIEEVCFCCFFFPLKSEFWKDVPTSKVFFICACKNIILVYQKSLNLAIFRVKCLLIHNKASTYKYKCCTYTTKSFQCVSTEDKPLSVFQLSKSFSVSFTYCPNGPGTSDNNEDRIWIWSNGSGDLQPLLDWDAESTLSPAFVAKCRLQDFFKIWTDIVQISLFSPQAVPIWASLRNNQQLRRQRSCLMPTWCSKVHPSHTPFRVWPWGL